MTIKQAGEAVARPLAAFKWVVPLRPSVRLALQLRHENGELERKRTKAGEYAYRIPKEEII